MVKNPERPRRFLQPELVKLPEFWSEFYWDVRESLESDHDLATKAVFGVTQRQASAWFEKRERVRLPAKEFPVYSVPIDLGPVGQLLVEESMFPDDFEIHFQAVLPRSEPIFLGSAGGHFRLPALRWEEVMAASKIAEGPDWLRRAVPLLLFRGTWLTTDDDRSQAREVLLSAWESIGIVAAKHRVAFVEEMIDEIDDELRWTKDRKLGWLTNEEYSVRGLDRLNKVGDKKDDLEAIKRFFEALLKESSKAESPRRKRRRGS